MWAFNNIAKIFLKAKNNLYNVHFYPIFRHSSDLRNYPKTSSISKTWHNLWHTRGNSPSII